jgi:hypothetical protein
MKSGSFVGLMAVGLSMSALADSEAVQAPVAASSPAVSTLGAAPYVVFGFGETGGLAALDPSVPVTRVVAVSPAAAPTDVDDEIEPSASDTAENSTYALMMAGLAVLVFIATRRSHE